MQQRPSSKPRPSWRLVAFAVVLLVVVLWAWSIDPETGAGMAMLSAILLLMLTRISGSASRDRIVLELARKLPIREVQGLQSGQMQHVTTPYGAGHLCVTWTSSDEVSLVAVGGRHPVDMMATDEAAIEIARRLLTSRPPGSIHACDGTVMLGQLNVSLPEVSDTVDALFRDAFAATAAVREVRGRPDVPSTSSSN